MISKVEFVELGLTCADVCRTLNRGRADQFSQPALKTAERLTTWVTQVSCVPEAWLTNL